MSRSRRVRLASRRLATDCEHYTVAPLRLPLHALKRKFIHKCFPEIKHDQGKLPHSTPIKASRTQPGRSIIIVSHGDGDRCLITPRPSHSLGVQPANQRASGDNAHIRNTKPPVFCYLRGRYMQSHLVRSGSIQSVWRMTYDDH